MEPSFLELKEILIGESCTAFLLSTWHVDLTSAGSAATLRPQGHKHEEEAYLLKIAEEKGASSPCPCQHHVVTRIALDPGILAV